VPADTVLSAQGLGLDIAGVPVLSDLNFRITPGLTLVVGGDGRGKTSLLRVLAGQLQASAGTLTRTAASVQFANPADPAQDASVSTAWLAAQRAQQPGWSDPVAQRLLQALDLVPHAHKPLFMLSTGSRRKLALVAAAASGAALTLLDTPYAALDARSRGVVDELLNEATEDPCRAWVVADFAVPAALSAARLAGLIELGD
jgi:ABC-type transport system involved in cytochrome c biogenesis ATPase subunit